MTSIIILTVGKKHEAWIEPGVFRFLERLRPPFQVKMSIIVSSRLSGEGARLEESKRLLARIRPGDFVILLDERGQTVSSPEFSHMLTAHITYGRQIVIIIGGAYGVDRAVRQRADFIWSLSRLVFPHQLVRLILAEQLYRAQEIARGGGYHHG